MTDTKIYLNVPFAEKDEAKALGARWDAIKKKWYVSANKDISLFIRWQAGSDNVATPKTKALSADSVSTTASSGAKTYATAIDFIAYSGDAPPWD